VGLWLCEAIGKVKGIKIVALQDLTAPAQLKVMRLKAVGIGICGKCRWTSGCLACDWKKAMLYEAKALHPDFEVEVDWASCSAGSSSSGVEAAPPPHLVAGGPELEAQAQIHLNEHIKTHINTYKHI